MPDPSDAAEVADDVLRHSEDPGEWETEPVEIERRPTGNQVVSARIPTELATRLFAEVEEKGIRLSDLMRDALEMYFAPQPTFRVIVVQAGIRMRVLRDTEGYETENPTVTEPEHLTFAPTTVALGGA